MSPLDDFVGFLIALFFYLLGDRRRLMRFVA
jgi:hypothetical protein